MIIVILRKGEETTELTVSSPKELFNLLNIFEASPMVDEYKIIHSDCGQVKNINLYGWDSFSYRKLVTDQFNWSV